jgi:uroporphyrin-III C-methyltransferase
MSLSPIFMSTPRLTLVGAGPGDPELITLRGVKMLAKADVVLYDALVHPDLLGYAPAEAQKIFVGKRRGRCEFSQQDINALIVHHALHHGHVVRLKGGDPFVFGRGYEEICYAREAGIRTEVVPGISSSIAVPELQHIPLTCRGLSESFWVVTGTTRHHGLSEDIRKAAHSPATVVILMGMKHLPEIMDIYRVAGKEDLPVAVIRNGSWEGEKIALGTVSTIAGEVQQKGLENPAIIVVGEVVRLHPEWSVHTSARAGRH